MDAELITWRIETSKLLSRMKRNHLIKALTYRLKILLWIQNAQMKVHHLILVLKSFRLSFNVRRLKKPPNALKHKKWENDWKVRSLEFLTRGIKVNYRLVVSQGFKALSLRSILVTRTSSQGTKAFILIFHVPPTNLPTCVTSTLTRRTKLLKIWTLSNCFWRKKTLSFLMSSPSTR